jgi:hypothetical protein
MPEDHTTRLRQLIVAASRVHQAMKGPMYRMSGRCAACVTFSCGVVGCDD